GRPQRVAARGGDRKGEAATWEAATWEAATWEAATWEGVTTGGGWGGGKQGEDKGGGGKETMHTNSHHTQFRRVFFLIGILLGVTATIAAVGPSNIQSHLDPYFDPALQRFSDLINVVMNEVEFPSVLPNGMAEFTEGFWANWSNISINFPAMPSPQSFIFRSQKTSIDNEEFAIGAKLAAEEGMYAKHPVILIPGIVSTGLEVWSTPPPCAVPNATTPKNHHHTNLTNEEELIAERNRACGQKYFRKRMWGTMNQFRAVLLDRDCWMQHMLLSPKTGLDPPGVKLRAAQGLDAADYLFPGYWVWARIISNLAAIGYDSNNMHLAAYDWRLTFQDLETRDQFYTKLKANIELAYLTSGGGDDGSVVLVTHSMGSLVLQYFLSWVESEKGGKGGKGWAEKYLHGWVNIAGPMLGVPKSISSLLSGETRDTAHLNAMAAYILEHFFSRQERAELFRSWGGLPSMGLYGGDEVWGHPNKPAPDEPLTPKDQPLMAPPDHISNKVPKHSTRSSSSSKTTLKPQTSLTHSHTPDNITYEQPLSIPSFSHIISLTKPVTNSFFESTTPEEKSSLANVTSAGIMDLLSRVIGEPYAERWRKSYNFGLARSKKDLLRAKDDPTMWSNPMMAPLPKFKKGFRVLCEYGVGIRTERKYFYSPYNAEGGDGVLRSVVGEGSNGGKGEASRDASGGEEAGVGGEGGAGGGPITFALDLTVQDPERNVENGVQMTNGYVSPPFPPPLQRNNAQPTTSQPLTSSNVSSPPYRQHSDATVPLLSLGYMCAKGWKYKRYNPSGAEIVIREHQDKRVSGPLVTSLRGGPESADHVDKDILRIASGTDSKIEDRIYSNIMEIAERVKLPEGLD
ncbi:hypothetical protein HDV00_010606, partial [Rhizophlyctis rosea]